MFFLRVLLVEAGGAAPSLAHIPAMVAFLQKSAVDWGFVTEPSSVASLSTRGRSTWPRGKLLGGSSMLNYMLYVRGHSRDYDEWRDLGLEGWGWGDVLPYFRKSEDFVGEVEDRERYHGQGGAMKVTTGGFKEPIMDVFLRAGEELGYKVGDINGAVEDQGFTKSHTTTYEGSRSGTYRAFAEPFAGGNLTVLTHGHVTRVLLEDGRAVGVEVERFGSRLRLEASQEVVLSAGAIGTPHILMLSGIGDFEHLKEVRYLLANSSISSGGSGAPGPPSWSGPEPAGPPDGGDQHGRGPRAGLGPPGSVVALLVACLGSGGRSPRQHRLWWSGTCQDRQTRCRGSPARRPAPHDGPVAGHRQGAGSQG